MKPTFQLNLGSRYQIFRNIFPSLLRTQSATLCTLSFPREEKLENTQLCIAFYTKLFSENPAGVSAFVRDNKIETGPTTLLAPPIVCLESALSISITQVEHTFLYNKITEGHHHLR